MQGCSGARRGRDGGEKMIRSIVWSPQRKALERLHITSIDAARDEDGVERIR
jgi:hypothetical protein